VRVRFAPSPTGYLHIGGARTALFNWLFARHCGGVFVLRIEDTDVARSTAEAVQVIYDGLRWLGLNWDEGPEAGGNYGPYFQSQRGAIYERYLERLRVSGSVYEDRGAIRFRSPRQPVVLEDLVCGRIQFDRALDPDITIRRPDGSWIFHFVNVVDDIEMQISHVIRGEDHLSNTPKHIELYDAFGAVPPRFAHIPLILNHDGSKMSKRDKGASLGSYSEEGYVAEAVRNYLCLLGWSPKDDREKMTMQEVIEIFELRNINRKNAIFDLDKLMWLNAEYVREMDAERFCALAIDTLERAGLNLSRFPNEYVKAALDTSRGKVRLLSELSEYAGFYFTDDIVYNPDGVAKYFTAENRPRLEAVRNAFAALASFDAATIEAALKATAAQLEVKPGVLVHPTRMACTGNTAGPSLYHLLEVLGKERVLQRIDRALAQFPFATQ
jgi:glutamyl-tRNA synthetase